MVQPFFEENKNKTVNNARLLGLWRNFEYRQMQNGLRLVLHTIYINQTKNVVVLSTDFPIIHGYLSSVQEVFEFEQFLLKSMRDRYDDLTPHQQKNRLNKMNRYIASFRFCTNVTAPLSKIFLEKMRGQSKSGSDLDKYLQALDHLKTLMPLPTPKTDNSKNEINPRFQKKYADKSIYEKQHSALLRNCSKRRSNAFHGLKVIYEQVKDVMIVQIMVESNKPFGCVSAKSPHFINRFLALRNNPKYKYYQFLGLVGYVKKLVMVNQHQAIGGFVTLIFDRFLSIDYHDYSVLLMTLLTDLAKEDKLDITVAYSSLFDDRIKNPVRTDKFVQYETLQDSVTLYTHMDYYQAFCDLKTSIEPDTNLIKLRSFEVSLPKE